MPKPTELQLLEAVEALTQPRTVRTTQLDDDGHEVRTHVERHPALLLLLAHGTGISRGSRKAETRIPIDAEKLEMLAQIRDTLRTWTRERGLRWEDDRDWVQQLVTAAMRWYGAHVTAVSAGRIDDADAAYTLRVVQSWVTRIERKYEPAETREWTDACPAVIGEAPHAHRCNARRVVIDGEERFAIVVNVTEMTAECAACGTVWDGMQRLGELRYMTNLWNLEAEMDQKRLARDLAMMDHPAGGRHRAAGEELAAPARELALTGPIDLP